MKTIILRYLYFTLGIIINSFGIALITKSNLGTSQISSIPYVISLAFPQFSFGLTTFIFNILFIIIEICILRKNFKPIQSLQLIATIIFSIFIDISMNLLNFVQPENFLLQISILISGCFILALGICIEVAPNVIVIPGEGVVRALFLAIIRKNPTTKFGTIKIYFDITLILIAILLSFFFFNALNGIGLGTILAGIFTGKFINILNKHIKFIETIHSLQYQK